jgi:hypothetical protein
MIANLIGGFIAILIGVSLIGPIATQVNSVAYAGTPAVYNQSNMSQIITPAVPSSALYASSSWGATVLQLVPGFFALGILGIGIAVTYSSLRQAGIV